LDRGRNANTTAHIPPLGFVTWSPDFPNFNKNTINGKKIAEEFPAVRPGENAGCLRAVGCVGEIVSLD
jgi:hypothetical protein